MEVPLPPLLRALKAASNASFASIRLTKKDGIPWLVMTIIHTSFAISSNPGNSGSRPGYGQAQDGFGNDDEFGMHDLPDGVDMGNPAITTSERRERETTITLDIPVHVLAPPQVEGLHEPRCREPDVHIYLPPLQQLKTISERFSRLASSSSSAPGSSSTAFEPRGRTGGVKKGTKLDLAATMHGHLRISLASDSLRISSTWRGLDNPELDAEQVPGGEDALRDHPSTRMRRTMPDEDDDEGEGWAKVRIDANDWRKVLSVGRVGGRVIACEY